MARVSKKKAKEKAKAKAKARASGGAMLPNAVYAVKGARNKKPSKSIAIKSNAKDSSATKKAISDGKKMAKVEAYAKEHKVTIAQAMIHFMD